MITLQHSLVYLASLAKYGKQGEVDLEEFKKDIPWVLLPDAIRCYTGNREYSHFEESSTINGDISWMEFPENLKEVSKENLPNMHLADGIRKAVIGETTNTEEFHKHNSEHSKYRPIRAHLEQDVILDDVVRELVDCTEKYEDVFTVNATGEKIDGQELRKRIASFEKYGFLHFAKNIYETTGVLVKQQWFDENVRKALEEKYSEDMAENTYKYMKIDPEIEKRISDKEFDLTEEDIAEIGLGDNVEDVLESMYQDALEKTIEVGKGIDIEENEASKTVEEYKTKIAELESTIKQLEEETKKDQEQIKRLQQMLNRTLEFCNKVRQSAVGKIFFGKDARKLPTKNELPEGRDER